jgi:Rhs element Vgr protein
MPSSPIAEDTSLISFNILSNGSDLPTAYEVLDIRIEQHINRISEAEITLRDGSAADLTFEVTDSDNFKPGAEIEIKLGYQTQTESVFKGIVVKQTVKIDQGSGSRLQIICKDVSLKLTVNRKNAIFTDITDSDLITQLAGNYGLSNDIVATTASHKEIVQYNCTDWDLIVNRAEINGLVVSTESGQLVVAKPDVSGTPELEVQFGYDILEFDGEIDATHQYSGVQGNAWDMSTQSIINASASEPTVNDQGDLTGATLADVLGTGDCNLLTSTTVTQDDIQAWADAALLKSRLSRFKGSVTFQGSSKAKVNSTIKLEGVSTRLNGNALITGVIHTIDDGRWNTEVKLGLSPDWFVEEHPVTAPNASGLIPGIKGLQTGIVTKIDSDPDNEFRVQVEIPILGAEGESVWARLSTFYNGNGFGAFFMPELNDEVILGFMNDDPRFPVILGSVYSSSIAAPETPDEGNTIKTIITQSKLQLKFDDENKVITILTPGGNTMVFSDEDQGITITDQSGNTVIMAPDGVTVESKSDLTLKAANGVTIQGATIDITGDTSISAGAPSVDISGDTSASLSGGATCDVSSDGQMSLKGSIVMIN